MNKNAAVNELLGQYLNRGISRRSFIQALGAVGISSAGISSMLEVAQAVERGVIPNNAHLFTGTVRRAFKVATTEPGGPVYLAITEAAQTEKNVT